LWLNRIEAQFTALRYFALDGADHANHKEQASMIRRYIIWRNNHAYDERLRRIIDRQTLLDAAIATRERQPACCENTAERHRYHQRHALSECGCG